MGVPPGDEVQISFSVLRQSPSGRHTNGKIDPRSNVSTRSRRRLTRWHLDSEKLSTFGPGHKMQKVKAWVERKNVDPLLCFAHHLIHQPSLGCILKEGRNVALRSPCDRPTFALVTEILRNSFLQLTVLHCTLTSWHEKYSSTHHLPTTAVLRSSAWHGHYNDRAEFDASQRPTFYLPP